MNIEQFRKAAGLVQKAEDCQRIEGYLREAKVVQIQVYIEVGVSFGIYAVHGEGQKFIIEKMIEAGIHAAMTIRETAENYLEKL